MINVNVLKLFCNSESNNELFQEPFLEQGLVCATDAHAMIVLNRDCVEVDHQINLSTKNYLNIVRKQEETLDQRIDQVSAFSLNNALQKIDVDHSDLHCCKDCGGSGTVDFEYVSIDDQRYTVTDTCPVCQGDGINENYVYSPYHNGWFDKTETAVQIKDIYFNPKYIGLISIVMKQFGCDSCTIKYKDSSHLTVFDVADGIKIYVMPIYHSDTLEKIAKVDLESKIKPCIE